MKTSHSTYTVTAGLIAVAVLVASNVEIQAGSAAAFLGYGTVLAILAMILSDYRTVSRRSTAK